MKGDFGKSQEFFKKSAFLLAALQTESQMHFFFLGQGEMWKDLQ